MTFSRERITQTLLITGLAATAQAGWQCPEHYHDSGYVLPDPRDITSWEELENVEKLRQAILLADASASKPATKPAVKPPSQATQSEDDEEAERRKQELERELRKTEELNKFRSMDLTATPVVIDPLGAQGPAPWNVHLETVTLRKNPHESKQSLGTLPTGTELTGIYHLIEESDEEWLEISIRNSNSTSGEEMITAWVTVTGLQRVHPKNAAMLENQANLTIGEEIVNRWWGIPVLYEPTDLEQVPPAYTSRNRDDAFLRKIARDSVIELIDASRADGFEVFVGSPYRSGALQKKIYDRNIIRSGRNQRYSAPPGHSEHQLGLTVDFVDPGTGRFLRNTDETWKWMTENAPKFGWRQTYTANNTHETGYVEEPWHWRYMGVENTVSWAITE